MSRADLGRWLGELAASLADALWAVVALSFDAAAGIGPLAAGLAVLGYLLVLLAAARLMQHRLSSHLARRPTEPVAYLRHERWFFLPAWPALPVVLLTRAVRALGRRLAKRVRRGKDAPAPREDEPQLPYVAASLGPSFLFGGAATALLFVLALAAAPWIALRADLPPGTPPWQYLLLGGRPELAPYLPLERRAPWLAGLLLVLLWGTIWWWCCRLVRLVHWRHLGRNLVHRRRDPDVLRPWRDAAETRRLLAAARPYRQWSGTLLLAAAPLAGMAWLALGAAPYRVGPAEMALALVLGLAWTVHLVLHGDERLASEGSQPVAPAAAPSAGWPEVREDLDRRLQFVTPLPFRDPRPVGRLELSETAAADPLLSPLLGELMPAVEGRRGLTAMQHRELHRLAGLGHVFTRPPAAPGELRLGRLEGDGANEVRRRNRVVLAPEGSGKTTLAMLAAANHALVHTRSTLVVLRDEREAEALSERFVARVDPSTLRWNLRVRRVGEDLAGDLAQGIVPDVVVTSVHHLAVGILDQVDLYGALLRNLGLILVDDAESFAGAVETHAQLAFRRLTLVCRKLLGVEQLGDEAAPLVLALGTESMHHAGAWIETLCGIEAEIERYGVAAPPDGDAMPPDGAGRQHEFYRLSDFRAPTGERLDVAELVESCESLGVPWCYRRAADGRRGLGRATLLLRDEPSWAVDDPLDAAVVLVEGAWSEGRREIERLALAGSRFPHGPVGFVTLVDPDEEMAFTQWDDKLSLAGELAALPRPVLRSPSGRTVASHLAADLTQSWTEVADLLRTFGNGIAPALRGLAGEGLLLSEHRTDVHPRQHRYEHKVYVRALASAVAEPGEHGRSDAPLPPKVSQVELACERIVPVLDRTDVSKLAEVDADSAPLAYYPGLVFADARGRWVVVHRASQEATADRGERRDVPTGAILAEPLLADDLSSPRRRMTVEVLETGFGAAPSVLQGEPGEAASGSLDPTGHAFYGPDPVRIGQAPLEVGLAKVAVSSRHHATYLLGPVFAEVRQRRLFDRETRERLGESRLETVAVSLYPNPEGAAGPQLRFAEARLLAAAFRAVLPSMLRGAGEAVEVALQVEAERPAADLPLGPREGFFLFDLHHLGNGTARALYREGVELLLRLARLLLERVLYHDRLRALHDQWPDELMAPAQDGPSAAEAGDDEAARQRREREVRQRVLDWLDSRLRPEGGAAALAGLLGQYGSAAERGEGDRFDVGRCWWTRDGSVTDLVWAKHRWRLSRAEEAAVDVGFDRHTARQAHCLSLDDPLLEPGRRLHREHLADPAFALPDGTAWSEPRAVWRVEGEDDEPHSSQPGAGGEAVAAFHESAAALARLAWPRLEPLARRLLEAEQLNERARAGIADATARQVLAARLAAFAAGIPALRPDGAEGLPPLRPAEEVLLLRRGNTAAKSLLLATLLARCGVRSGLFVSPAEGRVLAAAALPDPLAAKSAAVTVYRDEEGRFAAREDSTGQAETYQRGKRAARNVHAQLAAWSAAVGLDEPPALWADLPVRVGKKGEADDDLFDVYVPVETAALAPPGWIQPRQPESWLFLPLVSVWHALDPREDETGTEEEP